MGVLGQRSDLRTTDDNPGDCDKWTDLETSNNQDTVTRDE